MTRHRPRKGTRAMQRAAETTRRGRLRQFNRPGTVWWVPNEAIDRFPDMKSAPSMQFLADHAIEAKSLKIEPRFQLAFALQRDLVPFYVE